MLTSTTPTTSASVPVQVPGANVIAPVTVPGATIPAATPSSTPMPPVEPQLAAQPANNTPQPVAIQKMSPIMLWYAVSVYAYAAAFNKTVENIINFPDGNNLFPMEADVNQPMQVAKGNQFAAGVENAFDMNSSSVANAIDNMDVDDNGIPLSLDRKNKEKETGILLPNEDDETEGQI